MHLPKATTEFRILQGQDVADASWKRIFKKRNKKKAKKKQNQARNEKDKILKSYRVPWLVNQEFSNMEYRLPVPLALSELPAHVVERIAP
ncbi:hypothetical protein Tco_0588014 [Tanacetum coccineum]